MRNQTILLSALAALALAGCASDDYLGNNPEEAAGKKAIQFDGTKNAVTRSTAEVVTALQGQFKVYGVKSGATAGSDMQDVFVNYSVWDNGTNWEYVADAGTTGLGSGSITVGTNTYYTQAEIDAAKAIVNDAAYVAGSDPDAEVIATKTTSDIKTPGTDNQTIKYWDYAAADYRFAAGSPVDAFTFTKDADGNIKTASFSADKGVYIADPVVVTSANYNKPVTLTFKSSQTKARVGFYETIPGYDISEIHFYKVGGKNDLAETDQTIYLQSGTADYFLSGSGAITTITYDWSVPSYTTSTAGGTATKSQNWAGATLSGVTATTSAEACAGIDYQTVYPTAVTAAPILVKCDYTLKSNDGRSTETIKVKGATAAIPAAYCNWETNHKYTYIFKISDNTNGYTGGYEQKEDPENPGTYIDDPTKPVGPAGLYPITFDALVEETTNNTQSTITTVATPSITTYQAGSETANGVKYVNSDDVDFTVVAADGSSVNGAIAVWKLNGAKTEAELVLNAPTSATATFCIGFSNVNGVGYVPATVNGAGYYAIQYVVSAGSSAELYADATEYNAAKGTTLDDAAFAALSDEEKTKTPAVAAVYAYKVVYVEAAS